MKASAKPSDELLDKIKTHKPEIVEHLQSVEKFVVAVRTIWPEARLLTDAERAEDTRFREQIVLVREDNARAYGSQKPWKKKYDFLTKPWEDVRESVRVKLIEHEEETYVLARSQGRRDKEQSMRRRRLKKLIRRLRELQRQDLTRDELLLKLGAAKKEAGKAYALLVIHTPTKDQPVTSETFHFALDQKKLRQARRREGSYLLRSNIKSDDPGHLWRLYLQLVEVEQAFNRPYQHGAAWVEGQVLKPPARVEAAHTVIERMRDDAHAANDLGGA